MALEKSEQCIDSEIPSSFIDLPKSIRTQILREAGLVRKCPVWFSLERKRVVARKSALRAPLADPLRCCKMAKHPNISNIENRSTYELPCMHTEFPMMLLRINRQVYKEGMECFYGENNFVIDCADDNAIRTLSRLRPSTVRSIGSLFVTFHDWTNGFGDRLMYREAEKALITSDKWMRDQFKWDERLEKQWEASLLALENWDTLCHLFRRHKPSHMSLSVYCRANGINTIRAVAQGFYILPTLRELRVDFGYRNLYQSGEYMVTAQKILSKLSTRITGVCKKAASSFPFENLPAEVQSMILEECLDMTGRPPLLENYSGPAEEPALSSKDVKMGLPLLLGDLSRERWCCGHCNPIHGQCCCNHGTSWSSSCTCLRPQTALFGVNTNIRKESQRIFYSKNRFEILGFQEPIKKLGRELSLLLKDVCIVVKNYWRLSGSGSIDPWANILRELGTACDSSRLQVEFRVQRINHPENCDSFDLEILEADDIFGMKALHHELRDFLQKLGPPKLKLTFFGGRDGHQKVLWKKDIVR